MLEASDYGSNNNKLKKTKIENEKKKPNSLRRTLRTKIKKIIIMIKRLLHGDNLVIYFNTTYRERERGRGIYCIAT